MSKKDVKKANTEVKLTAEEKEELKGNEEGIRQVLINKAILDTAKKYEFTPEEKEVLRDSREKIFNLIDDIKDNMPIQKLMNKYN